MQGSLKSLGHYQSGIWEVKGIWGKKEWKKEGKNIFLPIKNETYKEGGNNHLSSSKIGTEKIKLELVALRCVGER